MPVVACPKCNKKYKLSAEQLGKTVKCSSCQAKFKTAAPAAAGDGESANPKAKSKAKSKAKPKSDPAPPAKKKPKSLEDELFASAPLKPGAPDPLGNFVLEDPGFGALELPDPEDDDDGDSDEMFANRKHLMENPALKDRNPYASPTGSGSKVEKKGAKKLRKSLLKHEGEVLALGWFYFVTGILGALLGLGLCFVGAFASADSTILPYEFLASSFVVVVGAMIFVTSAVQIPVGWFVSKFQGWAKICATILLVINLLGFPVGTAFSGYFLWVLHSAKGKQVFSEEYRQAVEATPSLSPPLTTLYTMIGFGIGAPIGYAIVKMIMG